MAKITIEKIDIDLTPEQVAELFCKMQDSEQMAFFNEVGKISNEWPGGLYGQLCGVKAGTLNDAGRNAVYDIANAVDPLK